MDPQPHSRLHEANRLSWNAATAAHNSHRSDQARFFREGGSTLFPEERRLLGDLHGATVVHLQCNAGQDTLSLARLGADVVGVDISDEAIAFATRLSRESGIAATFERADVYEWLDAAAARGDLARFDAVFCSYGAICWLSDLPRWAAGIASLLRPGGRFIVVEFHPAAMMFNERLERTLPYFGGGTPIEWKDGVSDYVAVSGVGLAIGDFQPGIVDFKNPHAVYEFQWTIADILGALLGAGLRIETFEEFPYSNGCKPYEPMRLDDQGRWWLADGLPSIPIMYAVSARREPTR